MKLLPFDQKNSICYSNLTSNGDNISVENILKIPVQSKLMSSAVLLEP